MELSKILQKQEFTKEDIVYLLSLKNEDELALLAKRATEVKEQSVGNVVYYRGLVEFSNICDKNCLYCGIRSGNKQVKPYTTNKTEILEAAHYALENRFGSMVLQSGELDNEEFISFVEDILNEIKILSEGKLGITLSCGEQTEQTYQRWYNAGGHRYLLRIETTNTELYYKIHPRNEKHSFENRLKALHLLKKCGYQVGTGVMIGLPFQTLDDLANDLLWMKQFDVDMVGMGPYIEHQQTPLFEYQHLLMSRKERFLLALKMIAILRIMMPYINIAAATALQAIDPIGREKAIKLGANVIMPNLTPVKYREGYQLYNDKPCLDEEADDCKNCLEARIHLAGNKIGYDEWGDSIHFRKKEISHHQ